MKQFKFAMLRLAAAFALTAAFVLQAFAVPAYLIPGGNTVGLKMNTKGLVILELEDGMAAQKAGLRTGDSIVMVDGETVRSVQALREQLKDSEPVVLTVLRGEQQAQFLVKPQNTPEGARLGVRLRDHIAGIGTVTYYDPLTRAFGALGHGISCFSKTQLLPMTSGCVLRSSVTQVQKGTRGTPGALKGAFEIDRTIGTLTQNREHGVFGFMEQLPDRTPVPVAQQSQVCAGPAVIYANVSGDEVQTYDIEIVKLFPQAKNGRDLLLQVTDPELLKLTGGIVQGMSGSPILQDGKLIGAVTHVLVNDPTRGYGIFIENMLDEAA